MHTNYTPREFIYLPKVLLEGDGIDISFFRVVRRLRLPVDEMDDVILEGERGSDDKTCYNHM